MTLPQSIVAIINAYNNSGFPPYSSFTPLELRKYFNKVFHSKPSLPQIKMGKIEDVWVKYDEYKIKSRLYYPSITNNFSPVLIYLHGGGFVIRDDMAIYDHTCRLMAQKTNAIVIAIDYRLAPENPFPCALNDCYALTNYFYENASQYGLDKANFNLIGESCGGNLVATVAMKIRDSGGATIRTQSIISPMLGLDFTTNSYKQCETGYILTKDTMQWFWNKYLASHLNHNDPYAVPLKSQNLKHLPKTLIVTTEYDVLRDDGKLYSQLLQSAGNDVTYKCYDGLIHGFLDLYYRSTEAMAAFNEIMSIVNTWIN